MNTNTLLLLILLQDVSFKIYVLFPKLYAMYLMRKVRKELDASNEEVHIEWTPALKKKRTRKSKK